MLKNKARLDGNRPKIGPLTSMSKQKETLRHTKAGSNVSKSRKSRKREKRKDITPIKPPQTATEVFEGKPAQLSSTQVLSSSLASPFYIISKLSLSSSIQPFLSCPSLPHLPASSVSLPTAPSNTPTLLLHTQRPSQLKKPPSSQPPLSTSHLSSHLSNPNSTSPW